MERQLLRALPFGVAHGYRQEFLVMMMETKRIEFGMNENRSAEAMLGGADGCFAFQFPSIIHFVFKG